MNHSRLKETKKQQKLNAMLNPKTESWIRIKMTIKGIVTGQLVKFE